MKINKKLIIGTIVLATLSGYITYITTKNKYETKIVTKETIKQDTSNTIAVYLEDEDGKHVYNGKNYRPSNELPISGYKLNKSTSYCEVKNIEEELDKTQTNIVIDETANGITFSKVNKKGSKCYLYYDEEKINSILANTTLKTDITTSAGFGVVDTSAGGLYEFDGMTTGSKTQFYRGDVTNNYVRLGKDTSNYTYWRIVRFDEEGNIRLIYDGTSAHDNGEVSNDRVLTTNYNGTNIITQSYNTKYGNAAYVGWTWTLNQQRPNNTEGEYPNGGAPSEIKSYLENTWLPTFKSRLSDKERLQLTTGKYCNDRSLVDSSWNTSGLRMNFGALGRLYINKTPSFGCDTRDTYTLEVGLLTADEYSFAGGGGHYNDNTQGNALFYLYTGQEWNTMSPAMSDSTGVFVYYVSYSGCLWLEDDDHYGVRPVITLKGSTKFDANTNGTKDNPYTIV